MTIKQIVVGELETNSYIFSTDDRECCIIDPGAEGTMIAQAVYDTKLVPKSIVFTHGHLDHLLGAAELISSLARHDISCTLYIHHSEAAFTGPGCLKAHTGLLTAIDPHMIPMYSSAISTIPKADEMLQDGDIIPGSGLRVIHTPGHSPGSLCFYHEQLSICFTGDTLFYGSAGRTDLPGGNSRELKNSLNRLVSLLPEHVQVFPGHGPSSTVGKEINQNPYL